MTNDTEISIQAIQEDTAVPLPPGTASLSPASLLAAETISQLNIGSSTPTLPSDTDQEDANAQHFIYPPLRICDKPDRRKRSFSTCSPHTGKIAKRLQYLYTPASKPVMPGITVYYLGEAVEDAIPPTPNSFIPKYDISINMPTYYTSRTATNWEDRHMFNPNPKQMSPTGLCRTDLYVYAIEANRETAQQVGKKGYRRKLYARETPLERFHPQLWNTMNTKLHKNPIMSEKQLEAFPFYTEPYENALSVIRKPDKKFEKVPFPIQEPIEKLHENPPPQHHSFSQEGQYLRDCNAPIEFFNAIYRPYEISTILEQTKLYRKQKKLWHWKEPTYEEIRCFIGLLLWTSLVPLSNRRCFFANSKIYYQPHFAAHTTRDRFEELLTMLHFTNNENLSQDLNTAERFEAKLGSQLKAMNANSAKLISPARDLSVDEMMVKFYGRSVVRQYMPAKPTKYGVKLWAITCSCCSYALTQNIYLGRSVGSEGGRQVVLELAEPYLDSGRTIFCDRYFSHIQLAAYLAKRKTGMVGTSNITKLPPDLDYLVSHMHPLSWAYKWYYCDAKFSYQTRRAGSRSEVTIEAEKQPVCMLVWMDKKYRTEDKKVVFITNCISAIPNSLEKQCHRKNIRDENSHYTHQLIPSPPILTAYNYRMCGVDRHDRSVGQHPIALTTKRGYIKVFFHILDSSVVNAFILYKTAKQENGEWNSAAKQRHTLAWFKESVILSLCGGYTSRKTSPSIHEPKVDQPALSIDVITQHQIRPIVQIPDIQCRMAKCQICNKTVRTACISCKQALCYNCGIQHQLELADEPVTVTTDLDFEQGVPSHVHISDESKQVISSASQSESESESDNDV